MIITWVTVRPIVLCIALQQVKIDNPKSNCFLLSQDWPLTQLQPTWLHHIKLNLSELWFTPWCINHIKNDKLGVVTFSTMTSIVSEVNGWEWLLIGLNSQLLYHQKHLTPTTKYGLTDRYHIVFYNLFILYFQGKRKEKYCFSRYMTTFNKRSSTIRYKITLF